MELESLYYRLCDWSGRGTVRASCDQLHAVRWGQYISVSIGCVTLYCVVLCIHVMMQTENTLYLQTSVRFSIVVL